MKIPVDSYNNILTVLELSHFGPIFDYFDYQSRKLMCSYLINNVLENGTLIPTQDQVHVKVSIITIIIFLKIFILYDIFISIYIPGFERVSSLRIFLAASQF